MKRIPTIVTVTAALALSGCINQEQLVKESQEKKAGPEYLDTTPQEIADYVPHKEGTTWTYYNGFNTEPTAQLPTYQSVKSGSSVKERFQYLTDFQAQAVTQQAYESYVVENNTLFVTDAGDSGHARSTIEPPKPLLKFPAQQDSTWTWEGYGRTMAGDMKHRSFFRVDTDVDIKTRAGRFKTIRVEETQTALDPKYAGNTSMIVTFWASGYGLVKQVSRLQKPNGQVDKVTTELAESSLLKGKAKEKKES